MFKIKKVMHLIVKRLLKLINMIPPALEIYIDLFSVESFALYQWKVYEVFFMS